jgi:phosphate transport system permease protein
MATLREKIWERILTVSAGISALAAVLIFAFLLIFSLPLLGGGHVVGLLADPWAPRRGLYGVMPMLLGTLYISSMSMAFALPLSFGSAALISVFAPRRFGALLRRVVQIMTGVPTVIYGFVGIFLLVPLIREMFQSGSGMCVLSASLMLAVVISPTMVLFFVDGFDRAPKSSLDAVAALGGSTVQQFFFVILPTAWKSVLCGIVLAFGRALGDTLIALMIAGNAVQVPGSMLESARTLTAHIALVIAADYDSPEFTSIFACGLILYIFSTLLVAVIRAIGTHSGRKTP